MSRTLPYFKFFTSEWLNGDITLEDYELQGIFINLCAYYWHKECEITFENATKKLRTNRLNELVEIGIIETVNEKICIEFLNEQFSEFKTMKQILSTAGKKGAIAKKEKAGLNYPISNPSTTILKQDKEIDNINTKVKLNITERKKVFAIKLLDYVPKFTQKTVNAFFLYWSEHGDDDKKMRFEKQTSFSIERRLGTWKQNEKKYETEQHSKGNRATTTKADRQDFN